jgi:hypothetical protein
MTGGPISAADETGGRESWHHRTMLDREEERRLAEIEAGLRAEDPALHELFAKAPAARPSRPGGPPRSHPLEPQDPLDPFVADDRTSPPGPVDPPRPDPGTDAEAESRHEPATDPTESQASPYDGEAEQRHPSHVPQRRWDDGPAFDAELARPPRVLTAIVRTFVALIAAVALTTITTLALGPNVGGFVSVVAFCLAGMYGYQTIRGCPGLRRARGQG